MSSWSLLCKRLLHQSSDDSESKRMKAYIYLIIIKIWYLGIVYWGEEGDESKCCLNIRWWRKCILISYRTLFLSDDVHPYQMKLVHLAQLFCACLPSKLDIKYFSLLLFYFATICLYLPPTLCRIFLCLCLRWAQFEKVRRNHQHSLATGPDVSWAFESFPSRNVKIFLNSFSDEYKRVW